VAANIPFADQASIFDSYQKEVIDAFMSSTFLCVVKSRRIGISFVFSYLAAIIASPQQSDGVKPQDVYYIGFDYVMTETFIKDCALFLRTFNVIAEPKEFFEKDGDREISGKRISLPSGCKIEALTSSPRASRSRKGVIFIDEAALHGQLDEVLAAALGVKMRGGKVAVISTYKGIDNDFYRLVEDFKAKRRGDKWLQITFKEALDQGLYRQVCRSENLVWSLEAEAAYEAEIRRDFGDRAAEELDCVPSQSGGAYIDRATIEAACRQEYIAYNLSPPKGFELKSLQERAAYIADWCEENLFYIRQRLRPEKLTFFGQDYAASPDGDLSVIAPGQYDDMGDLHVPFIIEMRGVPSTEQWLVWDYILERCYYACGKLDGRGNGQDTAKYLQDHYGGVDQWEAVMATQKTYLEWMPRLKARIEDRTLLLPKTAGVIDDLRLITVINGVPMVRGRASEKNSAHKTHGDRAIAFMNLVAAADQDIGEIDFHSAGKRESGGGTTVATDVGFGTVRRSGTDDFQNLGEVY
jgi:phage FluMu gp28-like protein